MAMYSDRRQRVLEAAKRKVHERSERQRKEASLLLDKFDVVDDQENELVSPSQFQQHSQHRRRRIYENHYSRPYPSKKKVFPSLQFRSNSNSPPTTPSTVNSIQAVTPSPRDKLDREWISSAPNVQKKSHLQRIETIEPRKLWNKGSQEMDTSVDMLPVNTGNSTVLTNSPMPSRSYGSQPMQVVTPTSSHANSSFANTSGNDPSIHYVHSSVDNISPLSTPLLGDGISSTTASQPQAPIKAGAAPLQPVLEDPMPSPIPTPSPRVRSFASHKESPTQSMFESDHSLHQFLHESEDHTMNLDIDEYQEATFDRIVESLYGNSTLQSLTITCMGGRQASRMPGNHRTADEMACLLDAIRCLPKLHTLFVFNARQDFLPTLAEKLPKRLIKFQLHTATDAVVPEALLDALAKMESLLHVNLESQTSINLARLFPAASGSRLQTLKVAWAPVFLDEMHVLRLAEALACGAAESLVALDLEPGMDLISWTRLASAIRFNRTLQYLRVCFSGRDEHELRLGILELSRLLQGNATLRHITNHDAQALVLLASEDSDVVGTFLEALQSNRSIHELQFFNEDDMVFVAKDSLLRRNLDIHDGGYHYGTIDKLYEKYLSLRANFPLFSCQQSVFCGVE